MKPVFVLLSAVLVLASAAEPKAEQKKQAEKVPAKPVITEVALENLKIGILEKEDTPTDANLESVATFSKLGKVLEADQTKKIYATATLKNKGTDKFFRAHQVFAIFTHESGHESTFVFDYVSNGEYKLDIVLSKAYKDFDGLSGKYSVRFVAGDALMKNPFNFVFADIKLTIPTVAAPVVPKSQQVFYEPLKEIEHQFREPEKRPRVGISTLFAIICLAPLGVLVFAWLGIGINFGNMPASIWVPIFHISLTAVFGLYIVFWLQLNMFETLKYLAIVGAIAFLSGNRVLRSLSDKRKTKTE